MIPFYMKIRGKQPTAVPILLLSLLFLSASVYLICLILDVKKRSEIIITCAFLSVNSFTFEISTSHMYFADVFLLALFFSCLGVYFIHEDTSLKAVFLSFCSFIISFGLYPAFLTFSLCLFGFLLPITFFRKNSAALKRRIQIWIITVLLAGLAYMLLSKIMLFVFHLEPRDIQTSIFSVGTFSPDKIWASAIQKYKEFIDLFFRESPYFGEAAKISIKLLLLLSLIVFIRGASFINVILTGCFLLIFPIVSRMVNIITGLVTSNRTIYAQYLLLPFLIHLFFLGMDKIGKETIRRWLTLLAVLLSAVIIWDNIQFTNYGFIYQKFLYDRAVYHTGQVIEDLQEYDGAGKDKPVMIIGRFHLDPINEFDKYNFIEGFINSSGISYRSAVYQYAHFLGYRINGVPEIMKADDYDIRNSPEVKAMPCYPEKGYIGESDDYLVVKLSE